MNEYETEQLYQKIFSKDRIERWKSWKGNSPEKISLQERGDHPLAQIPKKKSRWNGGMTYGLGYKMVLVPDHPKSNRDGCPLCKTWDDPENLYVRCAGNRVAQSRHKSCHAKDVTERRHKKQIACL